MKRAVWFSKHSPLPVLMDLLKAAYGDVVLVHILNYGKLSANDVCELARKYDIFVATLPMGLIADASVLCPGVVHILQSDEFPCDGCKPNGYNEYVYKNKLFRVTGLFRVDGIKLIFEDPEPVGVIMWTSEKSPLPAQMDAMSKLAKEVKIERMTDVDQICKRAKELGADAIVPLLPLKTVMKLKEKCNTKIYWVEMQRIHACNGKCGEYDPSRDVLIPSKGGTMRHLRFNAIKELKEIILEGELVASIYDIIAGEKNAS